jgi:hypothetical protein
MKVAIECAACRKRFAVDEQHLGSLVRCICGQQFTAQAVSEPTPDPFGLNTPGAHSHSQAMTMGGFPPSSFGQQPFGQPPLGQPMFGGPSVPSGFQPPMPSGKPKRRLRARSSMSVTPFIAGIVMSLVFTAPLAMIAPRNGWPVVLGWFGLLLSMRIPMAVLFKKSGYSPWAGATPFLASMKIPKMIGVDLPWFDMRGATRSGRFEMTLEMFDRQCTWAESYGASRIVGVGTLLLPFIFLPILAIIAEDP